MHEATAFRDVLARLSDLMEAAGVEAAVIGGLAAAEYSSGRMTADIDLVAAIELDQVGRFFDLALAHGFGARSTARRPQDPRGARLPRDADRRPALAA
ncbi:MAG: hypothetical protein ACKVVT_19735 [Dehalococcoidia bacterium]